MFSLSPYSDGNVGNEVFVTPLRGDKNPERVRRGDSQIDGLRFFSGENLATKSSFKLKNRDFFGVCY